MGGANSKSSETREKGSSDAPTLTLKEDKMVISDDATNEGGKSVGEIITTQPPAPPPAPPSSFRRDVISVEEMRDDPDPGPIVKPAAPTTPKPPSSVSGGIWGMSDGIIPKQLSETEAPPGWWFFIRPNQV